MNTATHYSRKSFSVLSFAIIILLLLSIAGVGDTSRQPAYAQDNVTATVKPVETTPATPMMPVDFTFEENKGQFDPDIQFVASTSAYSVELTKLGVAFNVKQPYDEKAYQAQLQATMQAAWTGERGTPSIGETPIVIKFDEFQFAFEELSSKAVMVPEEKQATTSSYYIGDQSTHDVAHYARVRYADVYQGGRCNVLPRSKLVTLRF